MSSPIQVLPASMADEGMGPSSKWSSRSHSHWRYLSSRGGEGSHHHSSPTQLHTSLLHRRQLVTHNIGVPMKQATWGHQDSTHHTLFQGGRAGQNDQPAAAGQCASCKLQTRDPKACNNQLKAAADKHHAHTQHKQHK